MGEGCSGRGIHRVMAGKHERGNTDAWREQRGEEDTKLSLNEK
jgi:hypothetical protein